MDDMDWLDEVYQGTGGTGGIEGMADFSDLVYGGTSGISGIEGMGNLSDLVYGGTSGISGIEGMADLSDLIYGGTTGITGIEGIADLSDLIYGGTTGITGIEGMADLSDLVYGGTMGIPGIEGFADVSDEVYGGTTGITGIEGFADASDEVYQGAQTLSEEDLKDAFWKQTLGAGTAIPGVGTLSTNSKGETVITYEDGTRKVISPDVDKGPDKGPDKDKTPPPGPKTPPGGSKIDPVLAAILGGLLGLLSRGQGKPGPTGYQGGIPKYMAQRRPGQGTRLIQAAGGGLMDLAAGGRPARYLRGGTDGMADKIKTNIDGKQPARLSHGEFVIPADVVSHLGNGNSDAGADVLYEMMDKVRKARTGTKKQGKQINPRKYTPV